MQLRGPDGVGLFESGGVCLGHRRLAILDPESGQQPWVDRATGACLVFNGEIYNYTELRKELEDAGVHFHTGCDTELLMQAYVPGAGLPARLDGMSPLRCTIPGKHPAAGARPAGREAALLPFRRRAAALCVLDEGLVRLHCD